MKILYKISNVKAIKLMTDGRKLIHDNFDNLN